MNALIDATSAVVKSIVYRTSREFSYFLEKLQINLTVLTLVLIFVIIGLLFIVWAIYLAFNTILSPPLAALVSGGIAIIFSVLILLILRLLNRRKEKILVADANADNISLDDIVKNIALVKDNPLLSLVLMAMAGYLIGSSPSARDAFAEVIVKLLDLNIKEKK